MKKDILVPDIGDFEKVEIIEVLVKEGQKIQNNESIVTLESDKSSVEVPSTEEGEVSQILVKVGISFLSSVMRAVVGAVAIR